MRKSVVLGALTAGMLMGFFTPLAAQAQEQASGERQFRAFWVNTFAAGIKSPAEIAQTIADLQTANANAILGQLFPAAALPLRSGYIAARGATEIVGFEWIRYPSSVIGLGADTPGAEHGLFAAHFSSGGLSGIQYFSQLSLNNTGEQPADLLLTALGGDGRPLAVPGGTNPARLQLAPHAPWPGSAAALLGFPRDTLPGSYLQGSLVLQSSVPGVVGSLVFGNAIDGSFAAALPLQRELLRDLLFGHVTIEVFQAGGGLRGRAQRIQFPVGRSPAC